jgi:hypothetical protein
MSEGNENSQPGLHVAAGTYRNARNGENGRFHGPSSWTLSPEFSPLLQARVRVARFLGHQFAAGLVTNGTFSNLSKVALFWALSEVLCWPFFPSPPQVIFSDI